MIKVENLSLRFNSEKLLDKVSFILAPNSVNVITGLNGSGKTSLIKALSGLISCNNGNILIENKPPAEVQSRIGVQLQDSMLYRELTVFENLNFFASLYGSVRLSGWLQWIDGLKDKKVSVLSMGERAKVSITRALINNPDFLFLDEPTAFLDDASSQELLKLIEQWRLASEKNFSGRIVLIATHSAGLFEKFNPCRLQIADKKITAALDQ